MFTRIASSSSSSALTARAMGPTMARQLHATPLTRETMGEKVKDLGNKVNMKVGQGLASAIETGEQVSHATKEKLGNTQENVQEGKEYAAKKAGQATEGARKAQEDIKKELNK